MSYYGWKPYVPVAKRRADAAKAAEKAKKSGAAHSPIAPFSGAVAKTFWGKSWCENLERYSDYANRLPRGRTYVRNGSVIDLQVGIGTVRAQVMGSSLYKVQVSIDEVSTPHWKAISADCAGSIATLVELLQGKLSKAVMERICQPGSGLFPAPKEIEFTCSCPDWASMCKHVAAVLYGVGARLDQQPDLLFTLRGVDAADLIVQAGVGIDTSVPLADSGKVLDDAVLADVFGIEMDQPAPVKPKKASAVKKAATPRKPAATKTTAAKSSSKTVAKTATKVATKIPAKAPAKTPAKAPVKAAVKKTPSVTVRKKKPAKSG